MGIRRRRGRDFLNRKALDLGQLRYNITQIAALIPLAAKRHRRQIRRIRLKHQMLQCNIADRIRQTGILIGKHAANTEIKTKIDDLESLILCMIFFLLSKLCLCPQEENPFIALS